MGARVGAGARAKAMRARARAEAAERAAPEARARARESGTGVFVRHILVLSRGGAATAVKAGSKAIARGGHKTDE